MLFGLFSGGRSRKSASVASPNSSASATSTWAGGRHRAFSYREMLFWVTPSFPASAFWERQGLRDRRRRLRFLARRRFSCCSFL